MHCSVLRTTSLNSASAAEEHGRLDSATNTAGIEIKTLPAALADNTLEWFHSPLKLSTKDSVFRRFCQGLRTKTVENGTGDFGAEGGV
jgi:hypothetical protein